MLKHEVPLRAHNLIVGSVYCEYPASGLEGQPRLVVTQVLYRHSNSERIGVVVRNLDVVHAAMIAEGDPPLYEAPSYNFNDIVYLVGQCVNPDTWGDDDDGND